MKNNLKRLVALVYTLSTVLASAVPVQAADSALTAESATEVVSGLSWDFESRTDIANPANVDEVHEDKIFESGVWAREAAAYEGNPADYMEPYAVTLSKLAQKPENGGSQCVGINAAGDDGNAYRSLAMAITLSKEQLVPGRDYTLSLDSYYTSSQTKSVYAGFSRPSKRTQSTRISADAAAWINGAGYAQVVFNNEDADGIDGVNNEKWSHGSVTITPTEDMYENGYTVLYIGIVENAGVDAGESLYFDNIKINPEKTYEKPVKSTINYGKIWTFEEGADSETDVLGGFADNVWSPLSGSVIPGEDTATVPAYKSESEVKMYKSTLQNHGYFGKMAQGSTTCIGINNETKSDVILGTRVQISNKEIGEGNYTLALKAGATTSSYNLYAAVISGSVAIDTTDEVSTRASLAAAKITKDLGVLSTNWSKYQANLSISNAMFDDNGYATLVIYAGIGAMGTNETLYLDDISLTTTEDPDIAQVSGVSGYLTTVCDYEKENTIISAAVYDGNKLMAVDFYNGPQKAINHTAFNVPMPEGLAQPKAMLYVWNGTTLEPVEETRKVAAEYQTGNLALDWSSEWIDVDGNRYEESVSPTDQPDGARTAQLSINNGILTKAVVYDANGEVFSSGVSNSIFTIDVPSEGDYTVTVTAKDTETHIETEIGTYTAAEFDELTAYPSATIDESGKLAYKIGFEKQTLSYIDVANGTYEFVKGGAAGGAYSLYAKSGSSTAGVRLDAMKYAGKKVTVTAYVNVTDKTGSVAARGMAIVTPTSGSVKNISKVLKVTGGQWSKISVEYDLTSYVASDLTSLEIEVFASPQKYAFKIDDIIVSAVGDGQIIDDNETQYYALDAISSTPLIQSTNSADIAVDYDSLPALKDLYKDYFKMGACVVNNYFQGDTAYKNIVNKHFNSLVSDGTMRPDWYVDAGGSLSTSTGINDPKSLSAANAFMYFAKKNGFDDIVGHTIFTYGTSKWRNSAKTLKGFFSDENGNALSRDEILQMAQEHVKLAVNHFNGKGEAEHYKGSSYIGKDYLDPTDYQDWRVATWDICNEIGNRGSGYSQTDGNYRAGNSSNYVNFADDVGLDFYQYMYKAAREADPTLELRLNEAEDSDQRRDRFLKIIGDINGPNNIVGGEKLVDKIGLQTHLVPDMDPGYVRQSIERYIATGLRLDITEYDYSVYSFVGTNGETSKTKFNSGITKMREFEQALMLRDCFKIFKEFADSIDRVVTWTVSDLYGMDAKNGGYLDFLAMFDRNMNPKPMFWAIAESEDEFMERYPEVAGQFKKTHWTFDSISDMSYSFSMGAWTKLDADRYDTQPIIVDDGAGGGYLKVQRSSWDFSQNEGVRIKLSKEQVAPGKPITLKFKARFSGNTTGEAGVKPIYAVFAPPSTYKNEFETAAAPLEFITNGRNCGIVGESWTQFEVTMTPSASDFENGYISLYLAIQGLTPKTWNSGETPVNLCLDDIIIK